MTTPVTFDEFLDAELAGLRRYAAVLTGDRDRAHDVLADALLRAHTGWGRIGRMQFPAAYVRRMVTSTFLSEQRRWSVRHIRPTRTGDLPEAVLPDPTDAVDDRVHITPLLAALPPRQRAAIVLRFYLSLSHDDIATELGISTGAARTAVSRALAALRIAVADGDDAEALAARAAANGAGGAPDTGRTTPDTSHTTPDIGRPTPDIGRPTVDTSHTTADTGRPALDTTVANSGTSFTSVSFASGPGPSASASTAVRGHVTPIRPRPVEGS